MKKQTLLFLLSLFLIVSCANQKKSNTSDEDTTAESEVFESGVYYVSGFTQSQTTKSTGATTIYSYSISGMLYETWEWKGDGKSQITRWGSATFSIVYPTSFSFTINCIDNLIMEVTLSKTGKVLGSELLDSGCVAVASEITIVSDKFSTITNGFKREVSTTSTYYDYTMTYTYQKSSIYN